MISSNDFMRVYMINVGTAACLRTNLARSLSLTPHFPTHATLPPPSQRLRGNIQSQCVLISVVLAVVCHISVRQWVSLKWVILAQLTAQCSGEDVPAHCADRASSEHRDRHKVETSTCTPAQTKYWGQHNSFYTHIL